MELRAHRPGRMLVPMTEQEVHEMVVKHTQSPEGYIYGGLNGRRPPFYNKLIGRTLTLRYDDGPQIVHRFLDLHTLTWEENGVVHTEYYEALQIDDQVVLLAYLIKGSRPNATRTIVLDFAQNLTTGVFSHMGTEVSPREVNQKIYFGVIDEGNPTALVWRHHFTREIIGRSVLWSYYDNMAAQHFYLAPNYYGWQVGGIMGCGPARYVKINQDVYMMMNLEPVSNGYSGQQGVMLMNFRIMHDVGTFYGIPHSQVFEYYTFGARGYDCGCLKTKDRFIY